MFSLLPTICSVDISTAGHYNLTLSLINVNFSPRLFNNLNKLVRKIRQVRCYSKLRDLSSVIH